MQYRGARLKRHTSPRIARGIHGRGPMERAKKSFQRDSRCDGVGHRRMQKTLTREPSDDRPRPSKQAAWNADTKRNWHRDGQSQRQLRQPPLFVLDEHRRHLTTRQTDSHGVAQSKKRVVPAFGDLHRCQMREVRMLFSKEGLNERGANGDVRCRLFPNGHRRFSDFLETFRRVPGAPSVR